MTRSRRQDNEDTNHFNSKTKYTRTDPDTSVTTSGQIGITDGDLVIETTSSTGGIDFDITGTGDIDFNSNTVTGIPVGVNPTDAVNVSQLNVDGVSYIQKQTRTAINTGSAKTSYVHRFTMLGASTTVASEAALDQKDVILTSATGFAADQWVLLSEGTSVEEWAQIESISVETLTLKNNLINTHAATNTAVNDDEHFLANKPKSSRVVASGTNTKLPWMFTHLLESGTKTAEVSVLIPAIGASSTYSFDLLYNTVNTQGYNRPDEVFKMFESGDGAADGIPSGHERTNGVTIDADNKVAVNATNSLTYRKPNFTPQTVKDFVTNTSTEKTSASRVPHQRSSFYSKGRWWFFYGIFTGTKPYDLAFDSTDDGGLTWKGETIPTAFVDSIPFAAAQFHIAYDDINDKVWVCTNISETTSSEGIHGGVQIRRYSLVADGTITDDSGSWQTVLDETIFAGDFTAQVLSDSRLALSWTGKKFGGGGGGTVGDCYVTRQASASATWLEESGFPVNVTNTDENRQAAGIARLNNGGMAVGSGRWNFDVVGHIYVFETGDTKEGALDKITTLLVEATAGSGAAVSRFEVAGHNGEIHYTYQDSKQHIYYGKRDTSGVWISEVLVSGIAGKVSDSPTGGHVKSDATSPRMSFWDDNSAVVLTWSEVDLDTIFAAIIKDDELKHIYPLVRDVTLGLDSVYEHAMPAELCNGDEFALTWLSAESNPITKAVVATFDGGFTSSTKSILYEKQSVSDGIIGATVATPSILADETSIIEFSLYHIAVSTGGDTNDNYAIFLMEEDGSTGLTLGGLSVYGDPVATGGTNSFGYFDGSHNKGIVAAEPNTRYEIGIVPKATAFDLYVDGVLEQADAAYQNDPTLQIDKLRLFHTSTHTGEFHINAITVRPFDGTDTTGGRGIQPTG